MADPQTQNPEKDVEAAEVGDAENEQFEVVGEEENAANELTNQLMKNPEVLAALQSRLTMATSPALYIASLPSAVKRRLKALKKIQLETTKIEAKFYEEVHALECKYATYYQPHYEKRRIITTGSYEPLDTECDWPSDNEKEMEDAAEDVKHKLKIEDAKDKENAEEPAKGIPDFWLVVFKNVDLLSDMVHEHDEPILKFLRDIKVKFSESNPMGFTLEFYFESNEYFSNTVLTKEYEMRCEPEEAEPFSFDGPEIVKCKGCTIDWKKGKNVTVKTVKKKQKHKSHGGVRTITKTVQNDSFFNFFNPPIAPEALNEIDDDTQSLMASDFEIGHFIRERIVPRAVLYFTGEALDDDDFEEEGEEEGDDDDENMEDDEDDDPDYSPSNDKSGKKGANASECKQQ
uniref:Nucleosome assembly protein 1-like 4 n=1 Tax=Strigamia maritima TaxID=126957 RepID=T1JKL6_STRMM